MKAIVSFAAAVCSSAVLIGALQLIAPDGAMSRPVKYVLGLAFTATVAAAAIPLGRAEIGIGASQAAATESELLYAASAEYVYARLLEAAKTDFNKITVCTDKSEDGSIIITEVIVYSERPREEITEALGAVAENYRVEVING